MGKGKLTPELSTNGIDAVKISIISRRQAVRVVRSDAIGRASGLAPEGAGEVWRLMSG